MSCDVLTAQTSSISHAVLQAVKHLRGLAIPKSNDGRILQVTIWTGKGVHRDKL